MADVRQRPRQREHDVALEAVRLVVRRLVDAGGVEQEPDRQGEDADHERMPGAPEAAARAVVFGAALAPGPRGRSARGLGRQGPLDRAGLVIGPGWERRKR